MKFKPTGAGKKAYDRGMADRVREKDITDNPFFFVSQTKGATAAWWEKGWQVADELAQKQIDT